MGTLVFVAIVGAASALAWLQWSAHRTIRRQVAALAASLCPSCGDVFGAEVATRTSGWFRLARRSARASGTAAALDGAAGSAVPSCVFGARDLRGMPNGETRCQT
jgi:hypothetical protein